MSSFGYDFECFLERYQIKNFLKIGRFKCGVSKGLSWVLKRLKLQFLGLKYRTWSKLNFKTRMGQQQILKLKFGLNLLNTSKLFFQKFY